MRNFLADPDFQACVPFSLLLYTSAAFISLTRQVLSTQTMLILGVICHQSSPRCVLCSESKNMRGNHGLYRRGDRQR